MSTPETITVELPLGLVDDPVLYRRMLAFRREHENNGELLLDHLDNGYWSEEQSKAYERSITCTVLAEAEIVRYEQLMDTGYYPAVCRA